MSQIVLTGGAGFIGSCVLKELNRLGYDRIVVVDNLGTSDKWKNLVGKRFCDLIHKDTLFSWLEKSDASGIEAIIHLGACSSTVERDAHYLLENNYRYSRRLAQYAFPRSIRFIQASSAATYGSGALGFSDEEAQLESLQPLNMYGFSKHLFDLWLKREGLLDKVVVLKYFNVFGPNEYHKGRMASAFLGMLPQVREKGTLSLFASDVPNVLHGEQKRDFVYVKDVARMTCAFLDRSETGIFNIGSGEAISWNRLAHALFQAVKKPAQISYIPMPIDLQGKYQNFTQADMTKTKKVLGSIAHSMPFEEAAREYVAEYLLTGSLW